MRDIAPNMLTSLLSPLHKTTFTLVGEEQTPVLVIDDFVAEPETLINLACDTENGHAHFQQQASDFYPGIRKLSPPSYLQQLNQFIVQLQPYFKIQQVDQAKVIMSAFSISTTKPAHLRPIQMLPHFDTPAENQLAVVHYLCGVEHGGTSLYKHKATGFERITPERLSVYREQIKQQAIAEKLHENPAYIEGDTRLFQQLYSVEAKMNRAIIYPSNVLHSGNIRPEMGLSADPKKGRLTLSSFILMS